MKIGDFVAHIDDDLEGKITDIDGNIINVITIDDFVFKIPENKLVVIDSTIDKSLKNKKIISKDKLKPKKKNYPKIPEFDLHIEKVLPKHQHLDSALKLEIQLKEAERIINKMKTSHHKEIVLIHGHGKNILRKELEKLLKHKSIQFFDASYQKYGGGAIRLILK